MSWLTTPGDILPGWIMWALNFGQAYPEGDEDALFELGDAWNSAADELQALIPDLRRVTTATQDCYSGDGAQAIKAQFDELNGDGDYSIQRLVEAMHAIGHDTRKAAAQLEYTKLQEIGFALLTVWMVRSMAMAGGFTAAAIPAVLAAARESLAVFARAAAEEIAALLTRGELNIGAKALLRDIVVPAGEKVLTKESAEVAARSFLKAGGLGAGIDAVVQGIQLGEGHLDDGFDLKQTFQTGIEWGAGGLLGAPLHGGLSRVFAERGMSPLRNSWLSGGLAGAGAGVGMYAGGLGNQIYDHFVNGAKIDWAFHPQLLAAGFGLGAIHGAKHGFETANPQSDGSAPPPSSARAGVPSEKAQVITDESRKEGKSLYRRLNREAHPDVLGDRPTAEQALGQHITEEAAKIHEAANKQGGYSEQQIEELNKLRAQWHAAPHTEGATAAGSTMRASAPDVANPANPGPNSSGRGSEPQGAPRVTGTEAQVTGAGKSSAAAHGQAPNRGSNITAAQRESAAQSTRTPDTATEDGTLTANPPRERYKEPREFEAATPETTAPKPTTPESVAPKPTTPEPAVPEPTTPEPAVPEPTTPEPATPESAAYESDAPKSTVTAPTTPESVVSESGASESAVARRVEAEAQLTGPPDHSFDPIGSELLYTPATSATADALEAAAERIAAVKAELAINEPQATQRAELRIRAEAEALAAQDFLDSTGARTLRPGVALLDSDPPTVIAVSRSTAPDLPVGPALRAQFADQGVSVRYFEVRVTDSGLITTTELRGPGHAPIAPLHAPGTSHPATAASAPATISDRLHTDRQRLVEVRDALRAARDERARALELEPGTLDRRPGETGDTWVSRTGEVVRRLENRPVAGEGVPDFHNPIPAAEVSGYRSAVGELRQALVAYREAVAAVERLEARIAIVEWLGGERTALHARREVVRELLDQLASSLGVEAAQLRPGVVDATLAELRATAAPFEASGRERALDELERKAGEIRRLTADLDTVDADLAAVDAGHTAHAYHDQLVQERAATTAEREFWRAKRDDRAARLQLAAPETALAPADLADTIAGLRERIVGTVATAAIGEEPASTAREHITAAEHARRTRAIDNLLDAAERFNELSAELARIEQRLPGESAHPSATPEAMRAELDRLGRERAALWVENTRWRKMRADLAARLEVDPVRLGPNELPGTVTELRDRQVPAAERAEYDRQLDYLIEAAERSNLVENQVGRIQDRMAELAGAGREVMRTAAARAITERVGMVGGEQPRIIVVGPRDEIGRPRADHDAALRQALGLDRRLARAMTQAQTVIEYRRIVGEIGGGWRIEPIAGPTRLIPTLAAAARTHFDQAMWRDGAGGWHTVDPSVLYRKELHGKEFKIAKFVYKDPPDGMSTHGANTLQAALEDPFQPAHPGEINKQFLTPVPMGGRMDADHLPTYDDPFMGTAGAFFRLGVEIPKLTGVRFLHPDDPHTFKLHRKKTAWEKNYFETKPVLRQPMVRPYEPWEHHPGSAEPTPKRQAAVREWQRVQDWADEQYARFRAGDGDLALIRDNLAAESASIRTALADKLIDAAAKEIKDRLQPDFGDIIKQLTGQLRAEKPGDAQELLEDVISGARDRVIAKLGDPMFTDAQLRQIKNHLMRDPLLTEDPRTGDPIRRPLDAVADVAEAWQRLIDGTPEPADVLLLRDALAESNYLRDNPSATWTQANQHAIARGYDWDSNRAAPAAWRARIDYAPAPPAIESPLPPRPDRSAAEPEPDSSPRPPIVEPRAAEAPPRADPPDLERDSGPSRGNRPQPAEPPGAGGTGEPPATVPAPSGNTSDATAPGTEPERSGGTGSADGRGTLPDLRPSGGDENAARTPWLYGVGPWHRAPEPPTGPIPPIGPANGPSTPPGAGSNQPDKDGDNGPGNKGPDTPHQPPDDDTGAPDQPPIDGPGTPDQPDAPGAPWNPGDETPGDPGSPGPRPPAPAPSEDDAPESVPPEPDSPQAPIPADPVDPPAPDTDEPPDIPFDPGPGAPRSGERSPGTPPPWPLVPGLPDTGSAAGSARASGWNSGSGAGSDEGGAIPSALGPAAEPGDSE
ncbi:WXG100 family type VII secretion target [Nocardia inohanensis]|uniref:WXG100 family type VII secretion target n=1 Tax=Nocardia inohanensis TaxID=209246 RepID=UPI00082B0730|nr:WXG100 family type VII secretion target [Nocardia inohanensis]